MIEMKHVTQEVSEYTVFKDEDKGYYEEQLC